MADALPGQEIHTTRDRLPYYVPAGAEVQIFEAAHQAGLAVMLKGPTGCGKTRFVEHMAARLQRPLFSVACHEDLTVADLVGRYVLVGGETVWVDGPVTRAVREGGICYLDEVVEARQDTTVIIHPLADHRRELIIERQGGLALRATPGFCLVVSFNPGYQSVLKDLKVSTRQRMVSIELAFPVPEVERAILVHEAGADERLADDLVRLAGAIRQHSGAGPKDGASTRTLLAAAHLIRNGVPRRDAVLVAIVGPLTDDPEVAGGLEAMVDAFLEP